MTSEALTRKQLKHRRQLALEELLNVYQLEYLNLLKELSGRYRKLKSPFTNELSEVQRLLVQAKYDDLLKGSFQTQSRTKQELAELSQFAIPVLSGMKIVNEESEMLSFAQAEAFLMGHTATAVRSSSRLSPHLSTCSPQLTEMDNSQVEPVEMKSCKSALMDKMPALHRLETLCCAASNREMDRNDCLVTLLAEKGRFLIRQTSFTIGCGALNPEMRSTIDVDLSNEDTEDLVIGIFAIVWAKSDGRFRIRCTGTEEITVDGKKVKKGEVANLHHWSLMEINKQWLMIIMNQTALLRLKKRSREAMNV